MSRITYVLVGGELLTKSINGVITDEYAGLGNSSSRNPFAGYGRDSLPGGVNGIVNHADGKRYDSKSQYERAVRAKGCRIVGNDWNNQDHSRREVHGDYNVRKDLANATKSVLERFNGR